MKKVSKAILIGLVVLVVAGIALAVSLILYIQSPGPQARIQEELSRSLRLPLKLTNVNVSPWGGLRIAGITIPNGDTNFLEAASFNASYRVLPLLHGKFIITEMSVENPKVVWSQSADGKWRLPGAEEAAKTAKKAEPETAPAKPKEEKKSSFTVVVQRFDIKGGSVDLLDQAGAHVAVLTDVNMTYTSLTPEKIEGTATIGKVVWADNVTLTNLQTPFKYAGGAFDLPEIKANFAGGTLQGKYHTHEEKDRSPYKVALTAVKVDLDQLGTQMGNPPGQTLGSLTGQLEVHGDTRRSEKLDGEGHFDLRDGQFHQLDFFQSIGQLLGLRELSDWRVRDGHLDLHVYNTKTMIDKIVLNTQDLQFSAKGTMRNNDKRLNLTAQLSAEDAVVQQLPGMIRDGFGASDGGRRAVDFTITGYADKPKTDLLDKFMGRKINSQFSEVLGLLNGDKKQDDKKADKDSKKKDKDKEPKPADAAPATPSAAVPNPSAPATPPSPEPAAANP